MAGYARGKVAAGIAVAVNVEVLARRQGPVLELLAVVSEGGDTTEVIIRAEVRPTFLQFYVLKKKLATSLESIFLRNLFCSLLFLNFIFRFIMVCPEAEQQWCADKLLFPTTQYRGHHSGRGVTSERFFLLLIVEAGSCHEPAYSLAYTLTFFSFLL